MQFINKKMKENLYFCLAALRSIHICESVSLG